MTFFFEPLTLNFQEEIKMKITEYSPIFENILKIITII